MRPLLILTLILALAGCLPERQQTGESGAPEPEISTDGQTSGWTTFDDYARLQAQPPDAQILMPVRGVRVRQVADTFMAPRGGGRLHEGQDIFARRGTPVYSATEGLVVRVGNGQLGGLYVMVMGPGGRRYYYAHLERHAENLQEGDLVTPGTLLGYVGNTGNARTTPPHLHFGVYGSWWSSDERVINPLKILKDRDWKALGPAPAPRGQGSQTPGR